MNGPWYRRRGSFVTDNGFRVNTQMAAKNGSSKLVKSDTINRNEIKKLMKNLVDEGKTIEEAAEILYNTIDEELSTEERIVYKYREQFKYIETNGIDLKKMFENLYRGSVRGRGNGITLGGR